ncbi:2-oxoacid dehydrogenases acyltransferase-domain-containing protein [Xylariaceae sp. FL0804]|nr:2-oxoacid dehydrogenases acyltransferase-domain-containing protein [Xylariaceae sp. FL0804]
MFLRRGPRALRRQWQLCQKFGLFGDPQFGAAYAASRGFHSTRSLRAVKPVLLADIGEGIVECEIIQWFVEPEARVEEFSPLCEVQSDKASVEITSRFSGVVKKLYYDAGEMAKVGKPFVDIDIQGGAKEDLDTLTAPPPPKDGMSEPMNRESLSRTSEEQIPGSSALDTELSGQSSPAPQSNKSRFASLATPAVRHLSKELNVDITEIHGTGKDGRVLKEDIHKFVKTRNLAGQSQSQSTQPEIAHGQATSDSDTQIETVVPLTNMQQQMFKTMTRSLSIPHFLYADEIDVTRLHELRARLNQGLAQSAREREGVVAGEGEGEGDVTKLSYLPFIIKAVSLALRQYPVLNARVDVDGATGRASLVHRAQHNVGVAMDTPAGLLVPVVRDVGARSVRGVAAELARLQALAAAGRLGPRDLGGGTVTVSNIGSLGGTYVAPVIVDREVAILGVGRARDVPRFVDDDARGGGGGEKLVRRRVCNFSWSADHRVVDGATMARAAGVVRSFVEDPDSMLLHLR